MSQPQTVRLATLSVTPIGAAPEGGYRSLAIAVLTLAKNEAARAWGHEARQFLMGVGDYRPLLDLWCGHIGINAEVVVQWAKGKGYEATPHATKTIVPAATVGAKVLYMTTHGNLVRRASARPLTIITTKES